MTSKRKVLVSRHLGDKVMPLLGELNSDEWQIVLWDEDRPTTPAWISENIKDAEGALVLLTEKINEELLEIAGPNLRVVSTMSVGYDHIETATLKKRNIRLGYTPDVLTNAVADLTVLLALMATRNAGEGISIVRDGKWPQLPFGPFVLCGPQIGSGVDGKKPYTVGFLGFGRIAKATLKRLSPYGISRCIYANTSSARGPKPVYDSTEEDKILASALGVGEIHAASLDYVAQESDLVIVLAPGGKETYHIVDAAFLSKMKSMAVLVNTSRGTLVDTDALVDALKEGKIWAAGLDVVEGEPNIPADHPLLRLPRAVVLPHIGSATVDTREAMARLAVENLINGLLSRSMEHEVRL